MKMRLDEAVRNLFDIAIDIDSTLEQSEYVDIDDALNLLQSIRKSITDVEDSWEN